MIDMVSTVALAIALVAWLYREVMVSRKRKRECRESQLRAQEEASLEDPGDGKRLLHVLSGRADALVRLEELRQLRLGAPAAGQPQLTAPERRELESLRECGFTWLELQEHAPSWGIDERAVAEERRRIEEALDR